MLSRRKLLVGLLAAPAIVRPGVLMAIKPPRIEGPAQFRYERYAIGFRIEGGAIIPGTTPEMERLLEESIRITAETMADVFYRNILPSTAWPSDFN